jgi:hypothetical protein
MRQSFATAMSWTHGAAWFGIPPKPRDAQVPASNW